MYDLAMKELKDTETFVNVKKFQKNVSIDRLGLHATRMQIEILLDDISDRDAEINELNDEFENYRDTIENMIKNKENKYENEVNNLKLKIKEYEEKIIS
jgi:signal transduction protein with GAF and PtsI domain